MDPRANSVDGIKIRDKKFNWLISVQASREHKQGILVQIAVDSIKIRDENFNWLIAV